MTGYTRPAGLAEAIDLLAAGDALALAGGSDVVPLVRRGKRDPATLVDVRRLLPAGIEPDGAGLRIGAGTTLATLAADERVADGYAALHQAVSAAASPQLRNVGTVGGNLAQAVRCWYFRHPDLTCWLNGGDTCYAQIGDHRKHGLEAGDCISVAPSDLAARSEPSVRGSPCAGRAASARSSCSTSTGVPRRRDGRRCSSNRAS